VTRPGPRPGPRPRPRLSQHFLTDRNILQRIVDALDPTPGDVVVEIGAGKGSLTEQLLARGLQVIAIEKDRRLAAYHTAWMELLGDDHLKYYRLKRALEDLDDQFFNSLARTANAIPPEKRSLGRIFAHALIKQPQLIPVAARFFL